MKVTRLLFLFTLLLQSAAVPFASNSNILFQPATQADPGKSSPEFFTGTSSTAHFEEMFVAHQPENEREAPCGLSDAEDPDYASEGGLPEAIRLELKACGRSPLGLSPEQWYNFFRKYNIPPPEFA